MPNADWRYKLLLISVLFSAEKFSISQASQEWDFPARFWDMSRGGLADRAEGEA
jgi:hypothetical protein